MDDVFKAVLKLYDKKLLLVIYNILRLIEDEENANHREILSDSLISLLCPLNEKIRTWIQENLAV